MIQCVRKKTEHFEYPLKMVEIKVYPSNQIKTEVDDKQHKHLKCCYVAALKERKGKAVFILFNYVQWVLY